MFWTGTSRLQIRRKDTAFCDSSVYPGRDTLLRGKNMIDTYESSKLFCPKRRYICNQTRQRHNFFDNILHCYRRCNLKCHAVEVFLTRRNIWHGCRIPGGFVQFISGIITRSVRVSVRYRHVINYISSHEKKTHSVQIYYEPAHGQPWLSTYRVLLAPRRPVRVSLHHHTIWNGHTSHLTGLCIHNLSWRRFLQCARLTWLLVLNMATKQITRVLNKKKLLFKITVEKHIHIRIRFRAASLQKTKSLTDFEKQELRLLTSYVLEIGMNRYF